LPARRAEEKVVNTHPKSVIDFVPYITERTHDFTGREWVFERTHDFTGREWVFRAIDDWLADPDGARVFLLTGDPGCGKTAIAARLVQFSQEEATPPEGLPRLVPGFLSAVHFCSAREALWTNPHTFCESLAVQLSHYPAYAAALVAQAQGGDDPGKHPMQVVHQKVENVATGGVVVGFVIKQVAVSRVSPEDDFVQAVRRPLEALSQERPEERVILLIDALDEALAYSGEVGILSLLTKAANLPNAVRLIITTRPRTEVLRPLQRTAPVQWSLTQDAGLTRSMGDVRTHVLQMLDQRPKLAHKLASDLSQETFAETARDKSQGNFLYVNYLLKMLAAQPAEITRDTLNELPTGLEAIYVEFLERLLAGDPAAWEERYAPLLGTLAVARQALSEKQLAGIVGITRTQVRRDLKTLRSFLDVDEGLPASQRTYTIYHRSFVDFLLDEDRSEEYWCEEQAQHERIARHYLGQCRDNWSMCDAYGLRHLAAHLYALRDDPDHRGDLYKLIDRSYMETKLDAFHSHQPFSEDVALAIRTAEEEVPVRWAQLIRGCLIAASLGSMATNIPPEALGVLAGTGDPRLLAQARDYAALMQDRERQCEAYQLMGEVLLKREEMEEARYRHQDFAKYKCRDAP
jgi:hypothetical protein